MTARLATADIVDDFLGPPSRPRTLTPRGYSEASDSLYRALDESLAKYLDIQVSNFEVGVDFERTLILRYCEQSLRSMIVGIGSDLPVDTRKRLRQRLAVLLEPTEWDECDSLPNSESFRALLGFLATNRNLRFPSIFLSRVGLFSAAWRPSRDKFASLVFLADGRISWLVIRPTSGGNGGKEAETEEVRGTTGHMEAVKDALRNLDMHGATQWMKHPSRWRGISKLFNRD